MSRPLIISDCDEVLLYMVAPFKDWLAETQGVEFRMSGNDFSQALRWQDSGEVLAPEQIWKMLGGFFDTEMHRQNPIPGAIEGINTLAEEADVVILTNLVDKRQEMRREQLAGAGGVRRVARGGRSPGSGHRGARAGRGRERHSGGSGAGTGTAGLCRAGGATQGPAGLRQTTTTGNQRPHPLAHKCGTINSPAI